MAVGHIETFSYVFLSQLGASGTLIGTTITVGSAVELVMLSVSGLCMATIGHVTLIVSGMALYAVRLIGRWGAEARGRFWKGRAWGIVYTAAQCEDARAGQKAHMNE